MKLLLTLLIALALSAPAASQELSAEDLDRRRKILADLLEEHWERTLAQSPEFASILGDRRYNDRVSDLSERGVRSELAAARAFLPRFEAVDTTAFSEPERLNRDLMVRNLRQQIEAAELTEWQMPLSQIHGPHLSIAQLPSLLPFASVKDYDDYITRLGRFPRSIDDTIANLRKGLARGLMPPKFLLEKVAVQASGIATSQAESSPFAVPLSTMPEGFTAEEKKRIRDDVLAAITREIAPAYARLATFIRDEYAPRGRTEFGVWALPDGAKRYAFMVRSQTTTALTPDEIHAIGLREVVRIELEMLQIAKRLGHPDLASFKGAIAQNPDLKPESGQQVLDLYRKYIDQMYARLPDLFGRLPRAKLEVVPTPEFRQEGASAAEYSTGAPDGSRPGRVYVNTYQATSRSLLPTESTAYHEGVPGHHMQLSIQQELIDLPPFRQQGGETAFIEGWALYSERLGKEVGFYQDPYSDFGRLNDEMLRAIRLVVDTGLHHKKWSRDQVVQFFRDHSTIDEVEIQSETDRYIVWPGQALAYKIGQLTILRLRERAQAALGAQFDIREFHDEVLGAGSLPMAVLEERIDRWIARRRSR